MIVLKENNDVNQIVDVKQVIDRLILDVLSEVNKYEINLNDMNELKITPMQSK
jgi:hypothetical protein